MSDNNFLSSLSFRNEEYRGVDVNDPENAAASDLRVSTLQRVPRKPVNHDTPRTPVSSGVHDSGRLCI